MRGAIFDFNGTMLYDAKLQEDSWREFVRRAAGKSVSDEEMQKYVFGRNMEAAAEHFFGAGLPTSEIQRLEDEKESIYRDMCLKSPDFHLAAGLPQFLDRLVRRNIPRIIATASYYKNVEFFFERLGLDRWFDLSVTVYNDRTFKGKPEPDIFLRAAGRLGLPAADCVIFEDSRSGVAAARRAGAETVVGISSMLRDDELIACGADFAVKDYRDERLLALIGD